MRIAVLSETDPAETRVAATPETVKKYLGLGAVLVAAAALYAPQAFGIGGAGSIHGGSLS
jgi:H+-translocating NAD(P) transhydrogenase subunit alpha